MRVVVDTNVLVSIIKHREREVMNAIYNTIKDKLTIIVFCRATYDELKEVLSRRKFRNINKTVINGYLAFLSERADWKEPNRHGNEAIDPDDQVFIDLAVTTNCRYLITGNLKHMPQTRIVGRVSIVSPHEFATAEKLL